MKVKVRTQSLGDIDVDIPQTSRVSALRPVVAERTGLDAATLRFIFHGRVLDDEDVLTERGVNDGTTVLMVTRRPPAATDFSTSQTSSTEGSGSHRQPVTTNLVNAEINIMRAGFLSEGPGAEALVRSAVQRFAAPFSNSLSWQVDSRENLPQQGDLTILVRLLGNETNHPSSGARARVLRVTDILSRIILALQVIKEDLCQMVDDVINHRYSVTDEAFARLDECVLRLEETLLVPRSVEAHSEDTGAPAEGISSNNSSTTEDRDTSSSRNITRHSTRTSYSQLLSHVISTQADFTAQISSYYAILRNPQVFCTDEYSRCVAEVFQEHTRRMFHCFGHIFHCLSDISSSFETAELENLAPLGAEFESPFRTEAVFRIIALTGEESRIRTLGQQAAQAFHSAAHQPSMQNVRMQIFGDVRMCRYPGNNNADRRVPSLPRLLQNQPFVQFPTPVPNFSGPLDFSVLQRLLAPNIATSQPSGATTAPSTSATSMASTAAAAAAAGAAAGAAAAAADAAAAASAAVSASSSASRTQKDDKKQTNTNATNDNSEQQTRPSNDSTSNSSTRLNVLHTLFTEAFNHLLASRARAAARSEQATAGSVNTTTAPDSRVTSTTTTSAPAAIGSERSTRSGGDAITFQAVNVPISHPTQGSQPQISVAPGVISQFVVETDGLEEARQVINAAMQAIGGTAGAHHSADSSPSANPRWIQIRPISGEVFPGHLETSRRYPVMRMSNNPNVAQAWISGPLYANDRYLPCRSNFASTSPEINRTRSYQNALRTIREAALRYERSLIENSEQRNDAELITDRWSALRESDERNTRRILGGNVTEIGTMQNGPAQFQRVLGNILERIVHQMAMTDPDIAEDLGTIRNDFENYFNGLTSEVRNGRTDEVSGDNLASTSQEAEQNSGANVPSTSSQNSNNSALSNANSESTVNVPNAERLGAGEGGDTRWSRELQVLHLIGDIMNAPGGATVGQFLRRQGYQYSHTGGGFVNLLITMCCEVLDTRDFMRLLSGDLMTFGNYRAQMRRYIIEHVLDDNSRPSSEDLENVSRRFQIYESLINRLFDMNPSLRRYVDVQDIGRIDVAATAMNIDRIHLQQLLSLLINTSDGHSAFDFPEKLCEIFSGYFRRFVTIANLSSNSPNGYSDVLMQLTKNDSHGEDAQSQFREAFLTNSDPRSEFLLMRNLMESSLPRLEAYLREEGPYNLSDIADELVVVDGTAEELSWSTDSAETVIAASSRTARIHEREKNDCGVTKEGDGPGFSKDKSFYKVSNVKHDLSCFPESWIHVINEDIRAQQSSRRPQPLSHAYLSGDPFVQRRGTSTASSQNQPSTSHGLVNLNRQNEKDLEQSNSTNSDSKQQMMTDAPSSSLVGDQKPTEIVDAAAMEVDSNDSLDEQTKMSKAA